MHMINWELIRALGTDGACLLIYLMDVDESLSSLVWDKYADQGEYVDGWFSRSEKRMEEDTYQNATFLRRVLKKLIAKRVIEVGERGVPSQRERCYKINWKRIKELTS